MLGDGASCLRNDQRHRIRAIGNPCGSDVAYVTKAYLKRLATLDSLQPCVTQLRIINFPPKPTLAATIPPEPEAGPSSGGGILSIRGQLVDEEKDMHNMGYAVRSTDGRAHAMLCDMDIDNSKPHALLQELVKEQGKQTFLVRGHQAKFGTFAQDRCRFIYWLPGKP